MKFASTDIQETTLWQKGTAASPPSARPLQGWGREDALQEAASRADGAGSAPIHPTEPGESELQLNAAPAM